MRKRLFGLCSKRKAWHTRIRYRIFAFLSLFFLLLNIIIFQNCDKGSPLSIEYRVASDQVVSKVPKAEFPFGISNPYDQKQSDEKALVAMSLKDLGLSHNENGTGFVVDNISRKDGERNCGDTQCDDFDFTEVKELIDLVAVQGQADLWVVFGSPSNFKFKDGKERKTPKTYLPEGPVSREAYRKHLTRLVNYITDYGRKATGNSDWHVSYWNLFNEVNAEYRDTFDNDIESATTAYVNFVIDTSKILRSLTPQTKIVLAGAGSATDLKGRQGEFYRLVFSKIKEAGLDFDPFDFWESHWFGEYTNYKTNEAGYGVKDFIDFLNENGFGTKKFLIRAGATYSGQDTKERKGKMDKYQSEKDQSSFLVKRFIYNVAAGAKKIPWSTLSEHRKYQGEDHVNFNYIGLLFNGVTPDGSSPQDPGFGKKKLSYYTYKNFIEKLKGSDFEHIETKRDGTSNNVYLYKLLRYGKPIWIAWNDNKENMPMTLSGVATTKVRVTEALPNQASGVEITNYNAAFNVSTVDAPEGVATIVLQESPIFIEETEE